MSVTAGTVHDFNHSVIRIAQASMRAGHGREGERRGLDGGGVGVSRNRCVYRLGAHLPAVCSFHVGLEHISHLCVVISQPSTQNSFLKSVSCQGAWVA